MCFFFANGNSANARPLDGMFHSWTGIDCFVLANYPNILLFLLYWEFCRNGCWIALGIIFDISLTTEFFAFFLRFFFLMWTIFKVFIEFATILLLFYVLTFWLLGIWDLSSQTRDPTHTSCSVKRSLNHWTTREVPKAILLWLMVGYIYRSSLT